MRFLAVSAVALGLAASAVPAEVAVNTYRASYEGRLSGNQFTKELRKLAKLPGTELQGPRQPFAVRKVVIEGPQGVHVQMIATKLKGQSLRKIGRAIIAQTDCEIIPGSRVHDLSSFSGSGLAFSCRP